MNTKLVAINTLTLLALAVLLLRGQGAGPLNPPAAPADGVYKTLEQIEPRTPISSLPFTIDQSGSYYLTNNFSTAGEGVRITVDDVTLDLNGFTISSTAGTATGAGVSISGGAAALQNITIQNGVIRGNLDSDGNGGGFAEGVQSTNSENRGLVARNLSVSGCQRGIDLSTNAGSSVVHCQVSSIEQTGIAASLVTNCTAADCNGVAIDGAVVTNCWADGAGPAAIDGNVVIQSFGRGGTAGIIAEVATGCRGQALGGDGIQSVVATDCYGIGRGLGGTSGLKITGTASSCRGGHVTSGQNGIDAAIAIGCTVDLGRTLISPEKHLGTP